MRTQTVFGFLAALAILAPPANAGEAAPDPAAQREFGAKLQMCDACHGNGGRAKTPTIPIIWGQQENYLAKQIHDFQSGARAVEIMKWMAETIEQPQVGPTAAYFAKRAWPAKAANATATPAPRGIAVCQACHQADFHGASQAEGAPAPRLAGQSYEYLVESMRRFADGERKNNEVMAQLMASIAPADRETIRRVIYPAFEGAGEKSTDAPACWRTG